MVRSHSALLTASAILALSGMAAGATPTAQPPIANTDEIRSIVAETLADAETRSSLLAAGDAGHDGGFFIAGDGYKLNIGGNLQFRYLADFNDDSGGHDDFDSGFQMRNAQLHFGGTVNKDWAFYVQTNVDHDGNLVLEDAYGAYTFANGWTFIAGQVKAPFLRETLVANWYQLAVESSVAEAFFGGGRTKAVAMAKQADDWSFVFAFSDGAYAANTDFNDPSNADYAFTPRFQYKFAGDWKQFDDFTSPKGSQFAAMLGGAVHFQQGTNTANPADVDLQLLRYTVDLSIEGDGWNIFGAFYGSHASFTATGPTDPADLDDFGGVIQGGFYITEKAELFARWDAIYADDDRGFSESDFNFITAGVNYYWAGHAAKFTLDGVYSVQQTGDLINSGFLPNTNIGLLGDMDEGEFVVRAQFQLMF